MAVRTPHKIDRGGSLKRYSFSWVAVIIGRRSDIQPKDKPALIRRVSGMIVEKAWKEIIDIVGIEFTEAIVIKLGSDGENIKPLQDAIKLSEKNLLNTALHKSIDEHHNIKEFTSEDFNYIYIPLLDRVVKGSVGETIDQKPDLSLKRKTITPPSGTYDWSINEGIFGRKILVFRTISGDKHIDTKLTSIFRSYEEKIGDTKKIVIEYLPKQLENETN